MFLWKDTLKEMQKIYRITHILKCDFENLIIQVYWNHTSQKTFIGLEDVLKTPSTRLQRINFTSSKTSWRRLEYFLKTSCKDVLKTSWRRLEDMSWRRLEDMSWRCLEDMSWRPLKNFMETNKIFTGDICTTLKRIQNALISDDWFGLKLA